MIIYLYNTCSTCKKALSFLAKRNIPITIKGISKEPPTPAQLEKILKFQNGHLSKLLNTSGQLYRDMQLSQKVKEMPLDEVLTLLSSHGMLVKRPFLLGDGFGLTGFNEAEWSQKISEE